MTLGNNWCEHTLLDSVKHECVKILRVSGNVVGTDFSPVFLVKNVIGKRALKVVFEDLHCRWFHEIPFSSESFKRLERFFECLLVVGGFEVSSNPCFVFVACRADHIPHFVHDAGLMG